MIDVWFKPKKKDKEMARKWMVNDHAMYLINNGVEPKQAFADAENYWKGKKLDNMLLR